MVSASLPGQTGAGKSFTMMGSGASTIAEGLRDQGLTPRLCAGLFARIEQMQRDGAAGEWGGHPCHDQKCAHFMHAVHGVNNSWFTGLVVYADMVGFGVRLGWGDGLGSRCSWLGGKS